MLQEELAAKIGVSRNTVACWETRQRFPSTKRMSQLAELFGVSVDFLFGAETPIDDWLKKHSIPLGETVKIPVLGVIRAGEPVVAEENIIGWEDVSVDMAKSGDLFALRVQGDSMSGSRILPGDVVIVRCQNYMDSPSDIAEDLQTGERAGR